ncbi:MAG: sulfatase-like hydrolase/transferase [Holdemanella sp.]|nr:sulfatase-like hydrolase/transferase [Holdemanella sp.]
MRELLIKYKYIWIFPVSIFYYELLCRIFTNTNVFIQLPVLLTASIALGLLVNCILPFIKEKYVKVVTVVLLFILATFYCTECIIKNTFQVYMTLSTIVFNMKNVTTEYAQDTFDAVVTALGIIALYTVPMILYLVFYKKLEYKRPNYKFALYNGIGALAFMILSSILGMNGAYAKLYSTQYEFNRACEVFGVTTGTRLNVIRKENNDLVVEQIEEEVKEEPIVYGKNEMNIDFDALLQSDYEPYTSMDSYVSQLTPSSKNEYTGIFEGKNLILICAEAFSGSVVSEELTPTLYRLMHNGFYFSDYYQPAWGGSTSSGEFSMLMGIVPINGAGAMLSTIGENNYFTMGNQMQRLDYFTACFHNGERCFYNRDLTHENLGFNYYLALGNGLETMTENSYVSDTDLLCNTLDTYIDKQPFCTYYMTIDGHSNYNASGVWKVVNNRDKVRSVIGDSHSELVFNYYCYQMELENALTALIDKLEEKGIAQDTVIALTSDHYPYGLAYGHSGNAADYIAELYGHSSSGHLNLDKNAMIIWSGCLEEGGDYHDLQCEIKTPTYSLDMLPTLSNLFGLEYDSRFLVGRDVFSDQVAQVVWIDYSWLSDKGYYNAPTQTFTPTNPNETVSQEYIDSMCKIAENKINFSNQILAYDYYRHVFGEDTITNTNK